MAKKISKRSRAARRGEIDETTGSAQELENIPKTSDGVKSSIIRTTIKNEELLAKKMEKKQTTGKVAKKKNNAIRSRLERSDKLAGVLGSKIEQSIARARYVQSSRKAGWDQINKNINIRPTAKEKTEEELKAEEEDEAVKEFFEGAEEQAEIQKKQKVINAFALLDEAEA
ncbi:shuttling pre-60S factor Ecm1p [[Candida] anglica]|uniref:Shuttling pre-60S factor Ecm1p n=1 Tax=[Candida] anglica TaxID=148631 RepID=A0ABP0EJS2_9ASCO